MPGLGCTRSSRGRSWLSFQAVAAAQPKKPQWKPFSSQSEQGWPGSAVVPSPACAPGSETMSAPPAWRSPHSLLLLGSQPRPTTQIGSLLSRVPARSGRSHSSGCFLPVSQCPDLLSWSVKDTKRIVWSSSSIQPWCHSVTLSLLGEDRVLPGDLLLTSPLDLSSCPLNTRFWGRGKVPTSLAGPWYLHGGCHAEGGLCGGPGAPSRRALSYLLDTYPERLAPQQALVLLLPPPLSQDEQLRQAPNLNPSLPCP